MKLLKAIWELIKASKKYKKVCKGVDCNEEHGVEFMKKRVMKAVEMGFMDEEEFDKRINEIIKETLKGDGIAKGLVELIEILGGIK